MLSSNRFCQARKNEVDFLLQLHICSRSKNKGTKFHNNSLIHLNSTWTFLRKAKLKRQSALSYTNGKRGTEKGIWDIVQDATKNHPSLSFFLSLTHMIPPLFHSKSLTAEDLILYF